MGRVGRVGWSVGPVRGNGPSAIDGIDTFNYQLFETNNFRFRRRCEFFRRRPFLVVWVGLVGPLGPCAKTDRPPSTGSTLLITNFSRRTTFVFGDVANFFGDVRFSFGWFGSGPTGDLPRRPDGPERTRTLFPAGDVTDALGGPFEDLLFRNRNLPRRPSTLPLGSTRARAERPFPGRRTVRHRREKNLLL